MIYDPYRIHLGRSPSQPFAVPKDNVKILTVQHHQNPKFNIIVYNSLGQITLFLSHDTVNHVNRKNESFEFFK